MQLSGHIGKHPLPCTSCLLPLSALNNGNNAPPTQRYKKDAKKRIYFTDVLVQMDAKSLGDEYNKTSPPKQVWPGTGDAIA